MDTNTRLIERKSNFELLRIFAMIAIVAHHLVVHGIQQITAPNAYDLYSTGSLLNKLFANFLIPGGRVGVALFFMLTGFFLINKRKTSVKKVCTTTVVYGWFIGILLICIFLINKYFISADLFPAVNSNDKLRLLYNYFFMPLSSCWWFVCAYILLVLTAPLYNSFLSRFNKKGFLFFLTFLFIFEYVSQYTFGNFLSPFYQAVFYYTFGGGYNCIVV